MPKKSDSLSSIILTKLNELSERTASIHTDMINVKDRLEKIESHDMTQNNLLNEHIAGTKDNRARLELEISNRKDLEGRVSKVEKKVETVPNFFKSLRSIVVYIGAIAAAVYEIGRALGYWN